MTLSLDNMTHEHYRKQLQDKQARITQQFSDVFSGELRVFESDLTHYRMRAEFRVWHDGDDLYHIMFDQETKQKIRIDSFPVASHTINLAMEKLMDEIRNNSILRRKLFQIDYLSGLSNEIVISLLYHKPLDEEWLVEAKALKERLGEYFTVDIVGRARKQKQLVERNYIIESLPVRGRQYLFKHVENSFTQPNANVNCHMIDWAIDATTENGHDLLELYCGAGNFSLPLAQNFRKVVGTEISRTSVEAAQCNIEMNDINNVSIVRMSSEEFTDAYQNGTKSKRLTDAGLDDLDISTVLVDPPRAGVDADTIEMIAGYQHIVYISCNPDTLHRDIKLLSATHSVEKLAIFDQFPYTHHVECGAILKALN